MFILPLFLKCLREVEDLHKSSEGQVGRIKEISLKTMRVTKQNKSLPQLDKGANCNVDSLLYTCV
jgi:hypothetical protein